jgi:hypothetical protein
MNEKIKITDAKNEENNNVNKNEVSHPIKDNNLLKENNLNFEPKENYNLLDNYKIENENRNKNENLDEEEEINSDKQEVYEIQEDDDNSDYLPVYNTKNIIINYDNTEKRLQETNKLLYKLNASSTDDIEEDSLEIKIDLNLDKENPKELTYYDYKKVLNKY